MACAILQIRSAWRENRDTWDAAVAGHSEAVRARDPSVSEATIRSFGQNMFSPTRLLRYP